MKWKSAEIACINKVRFKNIKRAKDFADYIEKKFGKKEFIYQCNKQKGIKSHFHLTTSPIKQ